MPSSGHVFVKGQLLQPDRSRDAVRGAYFPLGQRLLQPVKLMSTSPLLLILLYWPGRHFEVTVDPLGWSQPDYRSTTCLKCSQGKSTLGNGSRICIGKDCKAEEYLDNAATDFSKWECKTCRKGAVCDAIPDATWSAVIARAGYYRMPGPAPQHFSPWRNKRKGALYQEQRGST